MLFLIFKTKHVQKYSYSIALCARNKLECKGSTEVKGKIKEKESRTFLIGKVARLDYNKQISIKIFNRFQNKIKNCSKPQYEWRPSDVCTREWNCIHPKLINETNLKTSNRRKFPQTSCPCSRTRPWKAKKPLFSQ